MKITKQIDDTHFEVEMQESDKTQEITVSVAHDYLAISAPSDFCTGIDVKGPYNAGATNCLCNRAYIQIPIREAQKILELIKDNKYLKPNHLLKSNGELNYLWNNQPIQFMDESGNWFIALRADDEAEYSIIPLKLYNKIKNS